MRYAVASEHLNFFRRERYIFFEDLFTLDQLETLKKPLRTLPALSTPLERYQAGRDLFRQDPALKSILLRTKWAEIAATLFHQHPLSLAYTQHIYDKVPFAESVTLKEISAFSEIPGGLLINLQTGSSAFLAGDCPLVKTGWLTPDAELALIVFMTQDARYVLVPGDPCVHALKKLGYGFGDRLENATHPLLFN